MLVSSFADFLTIRIIWRHLLKIILWAHPLEILIQSIWKRPRNLEKHSTPMILSIRRAWAASIYYLNYVMKAVCFSDELKHSDPWAIKPGQNPHSGSVWHPSWARVLSRHFLSSSRRDETLSGALRIQRAVCTSPGLKGLPVGQTRQMCQGQSRGQSTEARREGRPGFNVETKDAQLREQPRTEPWSRITGW